jgi:hypothetical protein
VADSERVDSLPPEPGAHDDDFALWESQLKSGKFRAAMGRLRRSASRGIIAYGVMSFPQCLEYGDLANRVNRRDR